MYWQITRAWNRETECECGVCTPVYCLCVCVCVWLHQHCWGVPFPAFVLTSFPSELQVPTNDSSAGRLPERIQLTPQQKKNKSTCCQTKSHLSQTRHFYSMQYSMTHDVSVWTLKAAISEVLRVSSSQNVLVMSVLIIGVQEPPMSFLTYTLPNTS